MSGICRAVIERDTHPVQGKVGRHAALYHDFIRCGRPKDGEFLSCFDGQGIILVGVIRASHAAGHGEASLRGGCGLRRQRAHREQRQAQGQGQ